MGSKVISVALVHKCSGPSKSQPSVIRKPIAINDIQLTSIPCVVCSGRGTVSSSSTLLNERMLHLTHHTEYGQDHFLNRLVSQVAVLLPCHYRRDELVSLITSGELRTGHGYEA
jgi:hypothetical protein